MVKKWILTPAWILVHHYLNEFSSKFLNFLTDSISLVKLFENTNFDKVIFFIYNRLWMCANFSVKDALYFWINGSITKRRNDGGKISIIWKNKNIVWPKMFKRFINDGFGIIKSNKNPFSKWVNELNNLQENIFIDKCGVTKSFHQNYCIYTCS